MKSEIPVDVDVDLGEADPHGFARIYEAWGNLAGLRTLFVTFVLCGTMLVAVAGQPQVIVAMTGLAAALVALVGITSAGTQFMQQAMRLPVSRARRSLVASPTAVLRTLGVAGAVGAAVALFSVAALLLLVLCKLPVAGPIAYILVLPVLTLAGVAVAVAALVVLLVSLSAVWQGLGVKDALARCRAIVRRRRAALAKNLAVLGLLAAGATAVTVPLVSAAFGVTLTVSALVLSPGILDSASVSRVLSQQELLGPGAIGTGLLAGAVATMLMAGLQLGLCLTYLKLADGIDGAPAVPMVESASCPSCMQPVGAGDAFCGQCGHPLR